MSSPWDPAITQAMQRHGGSNRSIPKTAQSRPLEDERPASATPADDSKPEDPVASGKPKTPAA